MNTLKTEEKNKIIIYFRLLIYGCISGYILVKTTRMANPLGYLEDYYMSLRVTWLDYFINEVRTTGIYTGLHRLYDQNAVMYLYLSYLNVFLGLENALHTFFYTQLIIVCGCIALYPVIFYRITGNTVISVLSILFFKLYNPFSIYLLSDSYWVSGVITFTALPVLFFMFRDKWHNSNWLWICLLLILGSVGNIFRSQSDLAVLVGIFILLMTKLAIPALKRKNYRKIILTVLVFTVTLWSRSIFTAIVPSVYQNATNQPEKLPVKGPWHTLYVGLGWTDNTMGLEYLDSIGYKDRKHLLYDISDGYYVGIESPRYLDEMKSVYFETVFDNLPEVFLSYVKKGFIALYNTVKYSTINIFQVNSRYYYVNYISTVITMINLLIFGRYLKKKTALTRTLNSFCHSMYIFLPLTALFIVCGILPGVVATPVVREYLFGAVAAIDCITMMLYIISASTIVRRLFKDTKNTSPKLSLPYKR